MKNTRFEALRSFWDDVFAHMMECWELDGGTFQDMAEKHRLIIREKYDPEDRHKNMGFVECETGEECFFNVFALIEDDLLFGWFEGDVTAMDVYRDTEPIETDESMQEAEERGE